SGRSRPPRTLARVVFPDPEGPMTATESPSPTERLTRLRAWNVSSPSWYVLVTSVSSMARAPALSAAMRRVSRQERQAVASIVSVEGEAGQRPQHPDVRLLP